MINISKSKCIIFGALSGILNGLLGAGGGMLVVPILQGSLDTKKSHATCVAIILPICTVSAIWYLVFDRVNFSDAWIYMLAGIPGALIGSFLLQKINKTLLKKAFAILILWAGIRTLFFK